MNPLHRFVFRFLRWNRVASLLLAICLLSSSTPAAPQTIVAIAREQRISFAFWYHSSGLSKAIQGRGAPQRRPQERQADRDAKVVRLEIHPSNVSVDLAERVRFVAVGYDGNGNAVGGVKVRWTAEASTAGQRARISRQGEFHPVAPGVFTVTAQAAGKSAQTTVTVRPGLRPNLNLPLTGTRQVSSRDLPTVRIGSSKQPKNAEKGSARNRQRPGKGELAKRSHASKTVSTSAPEPMPQGGGGGWDSSNYWSADDPGNRVGDPPGTTPDGGSGSGNFQFATPIYGAPGRGINISLGLAYNSRVWNKAGNQMSFDNDRGWPAPGFNLGFGKLLGMTINSGCMLVDPDGTRHSYSGNITFYNWGTYGVMHTTDGSFIDYTYWTGTNGVITSAQAKLPNGTVINYGAYSQAGGGVFPTSIEDANGNFIYITYVNNAGPRIQTISDTLGRIINFHYDSNNLLTAVTAPGLDGGTRTLVRLHYSQLTLNYGFAWPQIQSTAVSNPVPWVLDAIYYPGTGTGYWLNDSDSYSTYGMIRRVSERRNMAFSGPEPVPPAQGPTEQGTITSAGSVNREELYDYPLTPDYSLPDAPTYTTMTERWTPDGSASLSEAVTSYEVYENANPRTTTITLPNGTKNKRYSYNSPGSFLDGLVYRDVTFTTDENSPLQSSDALWEQGAYSSPRPINVQKTDERGQMTKADFSYGPVYNQVTEVRDLGYSGELLRSTRTAYQNSASYTGTCYSYGCYGRHIFNLPLNVEVYASDNVTRVSRSEYQYDGQPLTAAPNVVMHNQASNPHAEAEELCYWENEWNDPDCMGGCWESGWNCDGICNQIWRCPYDASTDYRGNVTQITSYADAGNLTGAVTETRRYDVTGNLVQTSTACCEQTTFSYSVDYQYAYPQSTTRGSATDPYKQVTSSADYDFNTGLLRYATDANNRTSETNYDPNTLRVTFTASSTGAHTDFEYNDSLMTVKQKSFLAAHPTHTTLADENVKYLNGRGQVRQEKARGPDVAQQETWDAVDTAFNNLGQAIQQSRPYRVGAGSPVFGAAVYDSLGRTVRVTAPDGSVTETYYNEIDFDTADSYAPQRPDVASTAAGETTMVRDAWGRERWGRTDVSGRLVEVVEPNPNGNGSVATGGLVTTYSYNTVGNLIQVNQGQQTRSFKHDSLGRLIAQKLAEVSATLNDNGVYVGVGGPGAQWGDVFSYDERFNLISRTGARGVRTVYNYANDPLNRLQSVSWDTSGFGDTNNPILPAATVTYQYRQKNSETDAKDITQLESVTTAGISTESYGFDPESRVNSKTLTLTSRPNHPFETSYIYDNLDRVSDVIYPKQWGNGQQPRKVVHHEYDIASRLSGLTYDGQSFASNINYNAASQTTSLNIGTGTNQVTESYNYNSQTGLVEGQTITRNGATLLDLSYDYANANGKRTGQLTKILNNLNPNKNRGYHYDALGRLVQATGGSNGAMWSQTYSYDRYGNRTNVTPSGYSAKLEKPAEPKPSLPTDLIAKNTRIELPQVLRRNNHEPISDTTTPLYSSNDKTFLTNPKTLSAAPQSGSAAIAFASNRDGSAQIYLMNAEGSEQTRLTNNTSNDDAPRWSPNNSKIVFQSDRDSAACGIFDIYSMNADGSGQTRLTFDPNDDSAPVWSPDGSKIAFQSFRNGLNYQVYVMNADGSAQINVSNSGFNDSQPSWSPDGTKIAFSSDRDHPGLPGVYVMNANGSNQTRLTFTAPPFRDEQPAWSRDGGKITFVSTRDSVIENWTETDDYEIPEDDGQTFPRSRLNVNKEVYVMNGDGSGQARLTNALENDETPSWSVDGAKIVFNSDRERECCDPTPQIWTMNADGSGQVNLSNHEYDDFNPSWKNPSSNLPPTVNITAPANGATFTAPASINITANAGDTDGTISRVEFYHGTTLLGTDTIAPYAFNWNNVSAGSYSLTAGAIDNSGAMTTSPAVNVTVSTNAAPTVNITSPTNGATFTAPASINITANANDSDGSIASVEFYQGTTLLGTDTSAPYAFDWNNVATGNYSLTARAIDNSGAATASSTVNITVSTNAPPTVNITSPTNGTTFTAPANINITANANDTDGTVSSVEFYQGTTLLGTDTTAPYAFSWNNVGAGDYSLTAKAIDNLGATTTSAPVSITNNPAQVPIPRDGHASLSYDTTSNRITTPGFEYDAAGNQMRALIPGGTGSQRYQYDAANRLVHVKTDAGAVIATHTYGHANQRLVNEEFAQGTSTRTYYVAEGLSVVSEYFETGGSISPAWSKSYVYLGNRLLSTLTRNGVGGEVVEYNHPDRLGTRLVTNPTTGGSFEQVTLPFGTALSAESTGATNRRFTSYDRSTNTGLDYAVNRHYDSQQGRFTQVDPIGMRSTSLTSPQTLNLYAYCANDPVNQTDPSGLGFFSWLGKLFKKIWKILVVVAVVVAVLVLIPGVGAAVLNVLKSLGSSIWSGIKTAANAIWSGLKSVGSSLKGLFTNEQFGLIAHLQDPLPAAPTGYEWILTQVGPVLTTAGGGPIITAGVTVTWTPVLLAAGGAVGGGTVVSAAIGSAAAPASPASTAKTAQAAKKPCNRARGTGQGDINVSAGTGPVSPTGGVMMNADQVHFYGGAQIGFSPLPVDGSIMVRNGTDIATGLNYNLQAGSVVGFSYSGTLNVSSLRAVWHSLKNGQFAFGGMTPGATASVVYVSKPWNIPCLTN